MTKPTNPITRLVAKLTGNQAQAQAQHQEPEDDQELEPTVKMHRRFISYGD